MHICENIWKICAGLHVVALILGLQTGCTMYCYFLCYWDRRALSDYYVKHNWVRAWPLGPLEESTSPFLYMKLGLVKSFVKILPKDGREFLFLKTKFHSLSKFFGGPDIRKLTIDPVFYLAYHGKKLGRLLLTSDKISLATTNHQFFLKKLN